MENLFQLIPKEAQNKIKRKSSANLIQPMLATLTNDYFSSNDWIYECKWDGIRILAYKNGTKVKLLTRNQKDYTSIYPEIVEVLKQQSHSFIIDGEIIALERRNLKSNFSLLMQRSFFKSLRDNAKLLYCVFDIIYLDGYDLSDLELIYRKQLLEHAINYIEPLLFTTYIRKNGIEYLKHACNLGWEGLIAKYIKSTYINKRSTNWLKFKCHLRQEFIIIGYTNPKHSRSSFGALLLGYYSNGKLHYAGKVGTGFSEELLHSLGKILAELEIQKSPFQNTFAFRFEDIHWVQPKLVAEVQFTEWTSDGKLRHPSFLGLRTDKNATEIIRE